MRRFSSNTGIVALIGFSVVVSKLINEEVVVVEREVVVDGIVVVVVVAVDDDVNVVEVTAIVDNLQISTSKIN